MKVHPKQFLHNVSEGEELVMKDGIEPDFIIRKDLPGFINLIGIESPGLTSAPAIARHVLTCFDT